MSIKAIEDAFEPYRVPLWTEISGIGDAPPVNYKPPVTLSDGQPRQRLTFGAIRRARIWLPADEPPADLPAPFFGPPVPFPTIEDFAHFPPSKPKRPGRTGSFVDGTHHPVEALPVFGNGGLKLMSPQEIVPGDIVSVAWRPLLTTVNYVEREMARTANVICCEALAIYLHESTPPPKVIKRRKLVKSFVAH